MRRPSATAECYPGVLAHLQGHPLVTHDELGLLSKFGLKFVYPDSSYMAVFDDRDTIACFRDLDRTCAEIARYSHKDADRYRQMARFMDAIGPMIGMSMARPPVSFGNFVSFLEKLPNGQDLILAMLKSAYDVILENFEHPKVQMHFLEWAAEALCGPVLPRSWCTARCVKRSCGKSGVSRTTA